MAYIPLHHKYRPQTFADLVGQDAIATTLTNALTLQKIAPAYLFTGPRGTGKTSSARILAKSLNCISSPVPTAQPCGTCAVCSAIVVGAALDIIEIDAASNTGVDNIREIIERAQYAPVQCRYKVYIIDECHMLSTAAFNSLLKTLEEPPPHVVFVLATTDPQRVLPTIISRCQRFDYRRIPLDRMVAHLQYIALEEGINIPLASVTLVAQIAQGGLRDAESLLDQLSLLGGEITPDRVWDLVGSVPERDLLGILDAIAVNDAGALLDRARHLLERGKEPLTILQNLAGSYRDLLIAKTAPQRQDLVALTDQTWQSLVEMAQTWDLPSILRGQQHLKDSEAQLKHSTQPRLWLEITLLGLLPQALPTPTLPPAPAQPASLRPHTSTTVIPAPPNPVAPPAPVAPVDRLDLDRVWEQVLQHLPPSDRPLFHNFGQPLAISPAQAIVGMKTATMQQISQGKIPELEKAFSKVLGRAIAVRVEVAGKSQSAPVTSSPPPATPPPPTTTPPPVVEDYLPEVEEEEEALESSIESPSPQSNPVPLPRDLSLEVEEKPAPVIPTEPEPIVVAPPRATHPSTLTDDPIPKGDNALDAATERLVQFFNGEIIDRDEDLFHLLGNDS